MGEGFPRKFQETGRAAVTSGDKKVGEKRAF
jgi:hypothetical protein